MSSARTLGISLATAFALSGSTSTASALAYDEQPTVDRRAAQEAAIAQAAAQLEASEGREEAAQEASEAADGAAEAQYAPKRFPGYAYKIHFLKHMISNLHMHKLELRELPRSSQHRLSELAAKKELIEKYRGRLHEVRAQLEERRARVRAH
jgi:hypothetical protein